MPVPEDNPLTSEKIALGRKLFQDRRLSRDKKVACASCHDPQRAFTDGRTVAVGVFGRKGTRSVPSLVNRGYGLSFFWDGRTQTLEEQVLKPIQDPNEMDMTIEEAAGRVRLDRVALSQALASYVRSILSGDAPVDRYMNGQRDALPEDARQGLNLFRGKANCTACHLGPNFTDERFHNTGVAWREERLLDQGRFVVTAKEENRGAFKTPTLREIARTAPYMHDGSIPTLDDVVEFYNRGGNKNPHLDSELHPQNLTAQEKQALLAFLKSLSGTVHEGASR